MNILISGGSGFIGTALTNSLLADGHKVWILTRNSGRTPIADGAQAVQWDGRSHREWLDVFSRMDAVVNLAGATIGQWPWSAARKKFIYESRINASLALKDAFENAGHKPAVLIQGSGIGYYGPRDRQPVDETAVAGSDFSANLAKDWEAATDKVAAIPGVRRAIIRTSLVLDAGQGILPLMALPVKMFAGGPLGNGQQGVSWIHVQDAVRAIRFLLEREDARGAFNMSSPNPASNADFMRTLAGVLGRPYWFPTPGFAMRLALGEMSTLVLDGQYALPARLQNLGFEFRYPSLKKALQAIYSK